MAPTHDAIGVGARGGGSPTANQPAMDDAVSLQAGGRLPIAKRCRPHTIGRVVAP
jgi:hypothetical protein